MTPQHAMTGESEQLTLLISLYIDGHPARDVGELLGLTEVDVNRIIDEAGVRQRGEAVQLIKRRAFDQLELQHLAVLVGVVETLAARLGLAPERLLDILAFRLSTEVGVTAGPSVVAAAQLRPRPAPPTPRFP
jgi:hypothetical protein